MNFKGNTIRRSRPLFFAGLRSKDAQQKFLKCINQCWLILITSSLIMLVFTSSLEAESWTVVLTAESRGHIAKVSFGVAKNATDDYDVKYDLAIPPLSPGKAPLSMSFANELTPLQTDIRGSVTGERKIITWTLNIDSEAQGKITWNTKSLPTVWRLTVEEDDMRTVREMPFDRGRSTITITAVMPTDVNNDGKVDIIDLILVGRNLGEQGASIQGDVNDDNVVNILDLALVVKHFGISFTSPQNAVGSP